MPTATATKVTAYCVKCRTKHEMRDPKYIEKDGRARYAGVCAACGTKMTMFVKPKGK